MMGSCPTLKPRMRSLEVNILPSFPSFVQSYPLHLHSSFTLNILALIATINPLRTQTQMSSTPPPLTVSVKHIHTSISLVLSSVTNRCEWDTVSVGNQTSAFLSLAQSFLRWSYSSEWKGGANSRVALGNDDLLNLKFGRSGKGREGFISDACMEP